MMGPEWTSETLYQLQTCKKALEQQLLVKDEANDVHSVTNCSGNTPPGCTLLRYAILFDPVVCVTHDGFLVSSLSFVYKNQPTL